MLKILIGNIFDSRAKTLVNTVNCVGVMGKGIALEFKKRYPSMYSEYVKMCKAGEVKPGKPYYYHNLLGESIINFPTKDDWRSVSDIRYVIDGLVWFRDNYAALNIESVAFPPLGCGNGGLLWEDVGPIMYRALNSLPIDIEIYAPFGTAKEQLTVEFLSDYQSIKSRKGVRAKKFNPNWLCIPEIIDRLYKNPCAALVGRTTYQKICYIAGLEGIDTGFKFSQGKFGPYSAEAKEAFIQMCNANYLYEKRKGTIDAIFVDDNFYEYRDKNRYVISKNENAIRKVTRVFHRIKNTAQAEMCTTIIYSFNRLKERGEPISEKDVFDAVLEWKPHWKTRRSEMANAIRDMMSLDLLSVTSSDDLPDVID